MRHDGRHPSESRKEARPTLIERSRFVEGKRDPRVRFELFFEEERENCTAWRLETSAQPNGHAIFELKEPADKNVLLILDSSQEHLELVLGDAKCLR